MNEKTATEIWDYLEDNQDTNFEIIAKALNITEQKAREYALDWAIKPRGEFIFALSKESVNQI